MATELLEFRAARANAKPGAVSEPRTLEDEAERWRRQERLDEKARQSCVKLWPFYEKLARAMLNTPGNSVCSPSCIFFALAALSSLASGNTLGQLLNLLNSKSERELRTRANACWEATLADGGGQICQLASSLWLNQAYLDLYNQKAIEVLQKAYRADAFIGEMGSHAMDSAAQAWVNEATGGKLEQESSGIQFSPETALALFSTIYLKANWESEFEARDTKARVFYGEAGRAKVQTMHQTLDTMHYTGRTFEALELPFATGGTACFILPNKSSSVNEVLAGGEVFEMLSGNKAFEMLAGQGEAWREVRAEVYLPKFEARLKTDLKPVLQALGVVDAFSERDADFGRLMNLASLPKGSNLCVSKAEHAAMFEVKEEGVEGAAYTEISMMLTLGLPPDIPPRLVFRVNRPFIYAVLGAGGQLLFAGAVRNLE